MSKTRRMIVLALVAVVVAACGGSEQEGAQENPDPAPTTVTTAVPASTTALPQTPASTTIAPRTSTTAAVRQPVLKDGIPQVTLTPAQAAVGGTVAFSGAGFTDSMWRAGDTLWVVGGSEGGCSLYAEAMGARVTLARGGLLEGEFVVPSNGPCRQSEPPRGAEVAPGDYRLAYGCTPCFIGELRIVEEALTPQSRLRADGVGPIRIGMTLDEARRAAGTSLQTVTLNGCVELVPANPSIGVALWSHDGRVLDTISSRTPSGLASRAGIRPGSTADAVQQAYPGVVRNADESGTYLVVPAANGLALMFEAQGGTVNHLFAGERSRIERGAHCP